VRDRDSRRRDPGEAAMPPRARALLLVEASGSGEPIGEGSKNLERGKTEKERSRPSKTLEVRCAFGAS
jgi:hypothetical protein